MLSGHQNKIKMLHPRLPTPVEKRKGDGAEKENEEPYPIKHR